MKLLNRILRFLAALLRFLTGAAGATDNPCHKPGNHPDKSDEPLQENP